MLAATTVAVETMQGMNLDADAADEVLGDVAIAIEGMLALQLRGVMGGVAKDEIPDRVP